MGESEAWKPQKVGGCRWTRCPQNSVLSHVAQDTARSWFGACFTQTAHIRAIFGPFLGHRGARGQERVLDHGAIDAHTKCSHRLPCLAVLSGVGGLFEPKKAVLGHKTSSFGRAPPDLAPPPRGGKWVRMSPPHNAVLKAHVSKLGWMTATFAPTKRLFGAWERFLRQGSGQRPWLGVPTSSGMCTSVIPRCHQSPIGGDVRFFLKRTTVVNLGSIGVFWGQLLSLPCMCICGMPREVRCTCPLIPQLCDKDIPLTAKPLGFQCFDGWTCSYESLSFVAIAEVCDTPPSSAH